MTAYSPWVLARMAGVSGPDCNDSSGGAWLRLVADTVDEVLKSDEDRADAICEQADSLVPVYTYERWKVFVDLAAWEVDTEGLADAKDMTMMAGVALYLVARRLLDALLDELEKEEA